MRKLPAILIVAAFAATPFLGAGAGDCDSCFAEEQAAMADAFAALAELPGESCCASQGDAPPATPTNSDTDSDDRSCSCPMTCCHAQPGPTSLLPLDGRPTLLASADVGAVGVEPDPVRSAPVISLLVPPPQFRVCD